MHPVIEAADLGQAVMRWSTYDAKRKCSYKGKDDIQGEMITFGSHQSESYLRVYDKQRETKGKGHTVEGSWVRWELEFKKERANLCVNLLAYLPVEEWHQFTVGLLKSYISTSCGVQGVSKTPPNFDGLRRLYLREKG